MPPEESSAPATSSPGAAGPAGPAPQRGLQGVNVYLVGMMGAGKSAVGPPLAKALGYRFIDADQVLEGAAGRSIPEIFASDGESGFRSQETEVLSQIATWHSLVVATGGGAVTRMENWGHMQQGVVVWLDVPESVLLKRLTSGPGHRPLLAVADPVTTIHQLLEERGPLYGGADITVRPAATDTPEDVATAVVEEIMQLPGVN